MILEMESLCGVSVSIHLLGVDSKAFVSLILSAFQRLRAIPTSTMDLFGFGPCSYLSGFTFLINEMQELDWFSLRSLLITGTIKISFVINYTIFDSIPGDLSHRSTLPSTLKCMHTRMFNCRNLSAQQRGDRLNNLWWTYSIVVLLKVDSLLILTGLLGDKELESVPGLTLVYRSYFWVALLELHENEVATMCEDVERCPRYIVEKKGMQ